MLPALLAVPRELQEFADHRNVTLAVSKTGWAGMNIFEEWASQFCDWLRGYRERRGLSPEASPGPPWRGLSCLLTIHSIRFLFWFGFCDDHALSDGKKSAVIVCKTMRVSALFHLQKTRAESFLSSISKKARILR